MVYLPCTYTKLLKNGGTSGWSPSFKILEITPHTPRPSFVGNDARIFANIICGRKMGCKTKRVSTQKAIKSII